MIKVYILIIVILLFSFCYKKRTVENFYHYEKKPKHRKYFDIILKNQKKLKSSKNAELIIKKAYQDKDFKNENRNSVIYGNIDIIKFDKKDTLWKSLTNKYGIKKASKLIPESRR
jgi:hypothetical protein